MSTTFSPEVAALRKEVGEYGKELAEMRGTVNQLNKIVSASVCQSIWQLIAVLVSLCVTIAGGLAYQGTVMDKRYEQIEKRFEQIEKRFEQSDKNFGDASSNWKNASSNPIRIWRRGSRISNRKFAPSANDLQAIGPRNTVAPRHSNPVRSQGISKITGALDTLA